MANVEYRATLARSTTSVVRESSVTSGVATTKTFFHLASADTHAALAHTFCSVVTEGVAPPVVTARRNVQMASVETHAVLAQTVRAVVLDGVAPRVANARSHV